MIVRATRARVKPKMAKALAVLTLAALTAVLWSLSKRKIHVSLVNPSIPDYRPTSYVSEKSRDINLAMQF